MRPYGPLAESFTWDDGGPDEDDASDSETWRDRKFKALEKILLDKGVAPVDSVSERPSSGPLDTFSSLSSSDEAGRDGAIPHAGWLAVDPAHPDQSV